MRSQSLLAASLSLFLLAVSSWAFACDLSCSLRQFHSNCETQGVASPGNQVAESDSSDMAMAHDMVMPGENGDHIGMTESGAKIPMVHVVTTTASCTHRSCGQGSSLASGKSGTDRIQSPQSVAIDAVHFPILSARIHGVEPQEGSPPLGSLNPLFSSLRI